jgi:hypothetical protein
MRAMELLVGISFFFAVWLTFLTFKLKEQKRINEELKRNNKVYLKELLKIGDEQEDQKTKETEKA